MFKAAMKALLTVKNKTLWLKIFIHCAALLPLLNAYYLALNDKFGADPVEAIIHFTGIGAFNLLLITLVVSPLAKRFKQGFVLNVRRLLGLYAFVYAVMHLLNFLAFEVQFDFKLFVNEIFQRPYITVGMFAFTILGALAITSVNRYKRRMGKSWQTLHNFIYLVVILVSIHFYWSVKSEIVEPSIYIIISCFLLSLRRKKFSRWLKLKLKLKSDSKISNTTIASHKN